MTINREGSGLPEVGSTLGGGRFVLERFLGRGGFGAVYQVRDREREATVALKLMTRSDARALARFKQEFRALAELGHPNLIQLYELHTDGEHWFFTMELLDAVDALTYVRSTRDGADARGPRPERPVASLSLAPAIETAHATARFDEPRLRALLCQLVAGLGFLHRAGHLHRDVTPENVLVTRDGRVVLLDFGLITDLGDSAESTIAGTPAYMAPEQTVGGELTEAADWYAVGAMLYELLTGRPPFVGPVAEVVAAKHTLRPLPPSILVEGIPADLERLCLDLLEPEPEHRPAGDELLYYLSEVAEEPADADHEVPFVGREPERRALARAFRETAEGAVVALIKGRSGMGKSALVSHFLDELCALAEPPLVLRGRCFEQESVPYKALDGLVDALSLQLSRLPEHELLALVPREAAPLARVFPALRQVGIVDEQCRAATLDGNVGDPMEQRRRAFFGLRELLVCLARRRTLVLFIDDLQWGDADSGTLLAELLRPPDAPPVLFVLAYRDDDLERSDCLRLLLPALERAAAAGLALHRVEVDRLDEAEALRLAEEALAERGPQAPALAASIVTESGGSPFFIQELARFAGTQPAGRWAPSLDEMLRARVAALPEPARRLLATIALAGNPLPRAVAARAAEVGADEPGAVSLLRRQHLLRGRGDQGMIEPYHDRIRERVVSDLPAAAARAAHQRLAEALDQSGRAEPEQLLCHYREAGQCALAARHAVRAAEQARRALAFDRAARLYREALALGDWAGPERRELNEHLGDSLRGAGRPREVADAYLAAADGAPHIQALTCRRQAAEHLLHGGYYHDGETLALAALRDVGLPTVGSQLVKVLWMGAVRAYLKVRGLGFQERTPAQAGEEALLRLDTCWAAAWGLSFAKPLAALYLQARHLLLALEVGEPSRAARALAVDALFEGMFGRRAYADRLLCDATRIAERLDDPEVLGFCTFAASQLAATRMRWQDAEALVERARHILRTRCTRVVWELDNLSWVLGVALLFQGELARLDSELGESLRDLEERGNVNVATSLRLLCSPWPLLARDADDEAERTVAAALRHVPHSAYLPQHAYALWARAQIALYRGQPAVAWRAFAADEQLLRRSGLLRLDSIQTLVLQAKTQVALLLARAPGIAPRERQLLLGQVDAALRWLDAPERRALTPFYGGVAHALRASLAPLRERAADAADLWARAEASFAASDMKLHAAVARRRRGELLGGPSGRALIDEADARIAALGVRVPERFAALVMPVAC